MSKKALLIIMATTLLAGVLMMLYFIVERMAQKKTVAENIKTLKVSHLYTLDSVQFSLEAGKPVVLVFFNSGCEHCQYELSEIKKKLSSFKGTQLLFLSSENIAAIKTAAQPFTDLNLPNVTFLKIDHEHVFEKFGALNVPHIFLYSANQKLVKEFKGETKIEVILKYLP